MGIVTLFKRFKALAAAAEKARDKSQSEETAQEETPSEKGTLADSVLQIQKMDRKRPLS